MPKRTTDSPTTTTSPKKAKSSPSPSKATRRNSKKTTEKDIEPPPVDFVLEQLSSEEEGEAGSDDEVDNTAAATTTKSRESPMKSQLASLGYVVEEDLGEDSSQQGPVSVNGQDKKEEEQLVTNDVSRKRKKSNSTSSSSMKREIINPTMSVNKLREQFFTHVNQFYEQMTTEEQDDDYDGEVVVDIATLQLFRGLYGKGPDDEASDRRSLLDQLFREYLLDEVVGKKKRWDFLLELSVKLAREEISSPAVPINLLSDLVELSHLTECEIVFHFIEQRLNIWKESIFDGCKTAVLRLCNDLLRRLSREQDTILCGKILIFLSNYFPLSERSGLNVNSDFNLENITAYKQNADKGGADDDDPDDKMEITEDRLELLFEGIDIQIPGLEQMVKECQQENKKGIQVDYNLYVKFWSIQEFFRDPSKLYNKLTWRTFATYVTDVLHAYKSYKLDESAVAAKKKKDKEEQVAAPDLMETESEETAGKSLRTPPAAIAGTSTSINVIPKLGDDSYFPKYLTNKRLLELQMGDPDFRRYFLVQLLIILQYLTSKVKFKQETQVLNEEQSEYVRKTEEETYQLLEQIPPEGKIFVQNLKHILKTEESWNKWKNEGCQAFKKPAAFSAHPIDSNSTDIFNEDGEPPEEGAIDNGIKITATKPAAARLPLGDIIRECDKRKRQVLGNPELTRLWNICPDNLEACRSNDRNFMPSIDGFFVEAIKELDPGEDPVPNTDTKKEIAPKKILGNPNFGWRALRLLARQSPLFFQIHSNSPITPMQNYLEFILKKIISEMDLPNTYKQLEKELRLPETKPRSKPTADDDGDGIGNGGDNEVVQGTTEEEDEMMNRTPKGIDDQMGDDKSGEGGGEGDADGFNNEKLRSLTEEEQIKLGKVLEADWKKLAAKLGYKKDEIEFFESEHKEPAVACTAILKNWAENEDDTSIAELLYILDGLGLKEKADLVIK